MSLVDVGVERVAQHRLRDVGHSRDVDQLLDGWMRRVALRGLGDVHGEIADALEIGVDLDRSHHGAQIRGDRLVQGQELQAPIVDLDVQSVEGSSPCSTRSIGREVAFGQPLDGAAHALLRRARPFRAGAS